MQVADGRRRLLRRVIDFLNVMRLDLGQFVVFEQFEGVSADVAVVAVDRARLELWRDGFDPELEKAFEPQPGTADASRLDVGIHLAGLGLCLFQRAVERLINKRPRFARPARRADQVFAVRDFLNLSHLAKCNRPIVASWRHHETNARLSKHGCIPHYLKQFFQHDTSQHQCSAVDRNLQSDVTPARVSGFSKE